MYRQRRAVAGGIDQSLQLTDGGQPPRLVGSFCQIGNGSRCCRPVAGPAVETILLPPHQAGQRIEHTVAMPPEMRFRSGAAPLQLPVLTGGGTINSGSLPVITLLLACLTNRCAASTNRSEPLKLALVAIEHAGPLQSTYQA